MVATRKSTTIPLTQLRYRDTGQVHIDFHRTTNGTIAYLRRKHGLAFLDQVFRRTAQDVYRSIWDDLKRGNPEQLLAHWTYYLDREKGQYRVEREADQIRLTVLRCPAYHYLTKRRIKIDPAFYRQLRVMDEAWSEGTPFDISVEILGPGKYVQTIRRVRP